MKNSRLFIIFLIIFVNLLGFGIILPLMPYYVESLGAGPITLGLLLASYSLFQFISAPILGELSDKIGRRPILLFSIGGTVLSFLLLGIANTIPLLFLARIIDGLSGGNISTAQAYIADITTKENRTAGMGVIGAAFGLGFIIGPALGGFLSQWGYGVPAFVAAGVALIATILTYFYLPESRVVTAQVMKKKKWFNPHDFYDALTHPKIGLILGVSTVLTFSFTILEGLFALFTQTKFFLTAQQNGYIFAYIGVIAVIMQMAVLKPLMKKVREETLASIGIISMACALTGVALSPNIGILMIAVTLLATSQGLINPIFAGLVSKNSSDSEQGSILGISQALGSLARLFGPIVGVLIFSQIGISAPYIFSGMICLLSAIVFIKFFSPIKFKARL